MTKQSFDWSSVGGYPANSKSKSADSYIPSLSDKGGFDWSSVGGYPANKKNMEKESISQLDELQKHHPYLIKLAEMLQGNPQLNQAAGMAGHFNKAFEGTGLPSAAKGFLGTGVEIGRGLANLIPGVNIPKDKYSEISEGPIPHLNEATEFAGSLGMGLPVYRGYQIAKKGIEALPHATKIPGLIRNMIAGGAVGSAISPENRGLGAGIGAGAELIPSAVNQLKKYNPWAAKDAYEKAIMQHIQQQQAEQSLKNVSSHNFNSSNPESLLLSAADKQKQLEQSQAFQRHHMPDQKMLPGQQLIPEAEHKLNNVNDVIRQTLGEGEPNIQNLSKHIVDYIEGPEITRPHPITGLPQKVRQGGLREEIGRKYDQLEEDLPEVRIASHDVKAVEKELEQLTSTKSNLSDAEKDKLRGVLAESHPSNKTNVVSGKKFFRAYRSMRRLEGEQRSKAFSGVGPKEHDEWIERANNTKDTYNKMEDIINRHFPEGTIKRLHEINHEYATKVAPLHENPMYQKMLNHGNYGGNAINAINALSGTTKGNDIINNIIQSDPEKARLLLGHHYSSKPADLLKPNKLNEPYINANPEISKLVGLQKQAHGELESAKHQAELYKHVEDIPKLNKEIVAMQKMAARLQSESEATGLSKAEVQFKKSEKLKTDRKIKTLTNRLLLASFPLGGLGYAYKKLRE